jgi:hypothetical protein
LIDADAWCALRWKAPPPLRRRRISTVLAAATVGLLFGLLEDSRHGVGYVRREGFVSVRLKLDGAVCHRLNRDALGLVVAG